LLNLELTEFMREMTKIRVIKKHPEYNEKQLNQQFSEKFITIFFQKKNLKK